MTAAIQTVADSASGEAPVRAISFERMRVLNSARAAAENLPDGAGTLRPPIQFVHIKVGYPLPECDRDALVRCRSHNERLLSQRLQCAARANRRAVPDLLDIGEGRAEPEHWNIDPDPEAGWLGVAAASFRFKRPAAAIRQAYLFGVRNDDGDPLPLGRRNRWNVLFAYELEIIRWFDRSEEERLVLMTNAQRKAVARLAAIRGRP